MIIKRNATLIIVFLVVSMLLTGCNIFSGPPESEESVKQKVIAHLISKGYKENEFNIEVKYNKLAEGKYGGPYAITVVFHDEPNVIYSYRYYYNSENKEITQNGSTPIDGKEDKYFKHDE